MSRAIFVSSCGDVFLTMLVHKLFVDRWYNEVDKFYINVNNHCGVPKEAIGELLHKLSLDPKVHIIYHPTGIGNGLPITEMTLLSKEDNIMLLEDDGFIFTPGIVNKCFQQIESDLVDIVGSPRGSCGQEIWDATGKKYNLDYTGYGDVGPNWWPNFFFCKRKDLLRTDLNFASITFTPGQYCSQLDWTFENISHGDTFVWACIQLRALGLRSQSVPQHKADPYEMNHKEHNEQNWHPTQQPFEWLHGGSLSSGWGGYLSGRLPDVSTEIAKLEIESRVAFWTIASDIIEGFAVFKSEYRYGIVNLIEKCQLNRTNIDNKIQLYKQIMNV